MSTTLNLAEATAQVADRFESEGEAWFDDMSGDRLARIAVTVAAPVIERQVRERIADAILAYDQEWSEVTWRSIAARIARGES
jgi:hypothetical protein